MKVRSFLVIGAGRFGTALAESLFEHGHEVVVVDRSEEAVEAIMNRATHAVVMDTTDERALAKLGPANYDVIIVAVGSAFESAILTTAALKEMGAKRVVAKATSALTAKVLQKVGADQVVRPEHDMGIRLAQHLSTPAVVDTLSLGEAHGVLEVSASPDLEGRLAQLRLSNRYHVHVIAVQHGENLTVNPGADFEIRAGDRLIVVGATEHLERFQASIDD